MAANIFGPPGPRLGFVTTSSGAVTSFVNERGLRSSSVACSRGNPSEARMTRSSPPVVSAAMAPLVDQVLGDQMKRYRTFAAAAPKPDTLKP